VSLAFTSNQPGLQAWSGGDAFDGSNARKAIHGGKNVRGQNDGYTSDAPPGLAMEFHSGQSLRTAMRGTLADCMTVYGAWMHPELEGLGWNTVLKKGEIYNNCKCIALTVRALLTRYAGVRMSIQSK
jgi:hypothetical protein